MALIFHLNVPIYKTFLSVPIFFTLEFALLFENSNLVNNFRTASARAFIFNMRISSDKTFITFYHVTLTFEFDLLF